MNNALMNEIAADAIERSAPAKAAMERVAQMVAAMREAQRRTAEAEEALSREKKALLRIEREDLPELLRESGFEAVTLEDGTKVAVADEISCSITEERAPDAHRWLRVHGYGSVIKTLVGASFGKDQIEAADALYAALLKTHGDAAYQTEKVHPSTLKSLLKELMEAPVEFPLELFGVIPYSIAKLSVAKLKKGGAL